MIRCYVGIMALGMTLFPCSAHAAGGFPGFMQKVTGKSTTVSRASDGTPLATSAPTALTPGGGWQSAGNYGAAASATGGVKVGGDAKANVNGKGVPVGVTGEISKADIAKAAAAAVACSGGGIVGAVLCAGAVAALPIAMQWLANAGMRVNPQTGAIERVDPNSSQSDGFSYRVNDHANSGSWPYMPTASAACVDAQARINAVDTQQTWAFKSLGPAYGGSPTCVYGRTQKSDGAALADFPRTLSKGGATPNCPAGSWVPNSGGTCSSTQGGWIPASMDDIAPYMNEKPIPSPLIVEELQKVGQPLPIGDIKVIGPSSITGPSTTTINNVDNSVKTQTTTNNYTYNGGTVTNISTTTQTTTKAPDGTTTTSTTETNNPGEEQPAEEPAPTDTALPPVPSLYQRKYPNGMEGIWSDYKDQLKGTDLVSLVGKLMPNVGDGGACPTWPINLELAQWASYGTHDVAPPCWIWDVAKAILILSALLLARSLVFGG